MFLFIIHLGVKQPGFEFCPAMNQLWDLGQTMAFFVAPGCSLVKQRIIEAPLQVIVGLNYLLFTKWSTCNKTSHKGEGSGKLGAAAAAVVIIVIIISLWERDLAEGLRQMQYYIS